MLPVNISASRRWWKVGISSGMQNIPPELPSETLHSANSRQGRVFPVNGTTHGSAGGITKVYFPFVPKPGQRVLYCNYFEIRRYGVCTKKYQPIYGL